MSFGAKSSKIIIVLNVLTNEKVCICEDFHNSNHFWRTNSYKCNKVKKFAKKSVSQMQSVVEFYFLQSKQCV